MIFYYFLPNLTKAAVQQGDELAPGVLAAVGLAEVLADVKRVPEHTSICGVSDGAGPGHQSGVILAPVSKAQGVPPEVGNAPDRQMWRPIGDGRRAWIGTLIGQVPSPLDLERWTSIGGAAVVDPCGWEWKVPIARAPQPSYEFGTLPQSYAFDAAGEPRGQVLAQWQWLWELAGEIRNWYVAQAEPDDSASPEEKAAHQPPAFKQLVKWAAKILSVNYRVGTAELNLLAELNRSPLTNDTVHQICRAAYGWEVLAEAKKNSTEKEQPPAPSS